MKKNYIKSLLTILVSTTLYSATIHDMHPIAKICNNNAAKIKHVMKCNNIHPLKWHTQPTSIALETTEAENKIIIVPSYIIIEKFHQGIAYPIVIIV